MLTTTKRRMFVPPSPTRRSRFSVPWSIMTVSFVVTVFFNVALVGGPGLLGASSERELPELHSLARRRVQNDANVVTQTSTSRTNELYNVTIARVPVRLVPLDRRNSLPSAQHVVTLLGNCQTYLDKNSVDPLLLESTNFLSFRALGEQLTSALLPLHSILRLANDTQRILRGPFVTSTNFYDSTPDTYAPPPSHPNHNPSPTEPLPYQFITNYWDIQPLFAIYPHLCLLASDPRPLGLFDSHRTLTIGIVHASTIPDGRARLLTPRVLAVPESPALDLRRFLAERADVSSARCVEIARFQRRFVRGDPRMVTRRKDARVVPAPAWIAAGAGRRAEGYRKAAEEAVAAGKGAEEEVIGERLLWMFTPAKRVRRMCEEFWAGRKDVREDYLGLHLRLEVLYRSTMETKCDVPSVAGTVNACLVKKCPPDVVLRNLADKLLSLRKSHVFGPYNHIFVARDYGAEMRSSSLRGTALEVVPPEHDGLSHLRALGQHISEPPGIYDSATNSLIDLVQLAQARHCVTVGHGSFSTVVNYYREARGLRRCTVFSALNESTCALEGGLEAVLEDSWPWKVLTGKANLTEMWSANMRKRVEAGVPALDVYKELAVEMDAAFSSVEG